MNNLASFMWASELRSAVDLIRRGLHAAEHALQEEEQHVKDAVDENNRRIEAGEVEGAVIDGEGDLVYDPNEEFAYEFMTIDDAVLEVRKSMMTALYHAWERVAREITGKNKPRDNHQKLEEALREKGIELHPELDHLRKLVNLAKHNSKEKAVSLWQDRRDLFYDNFDPEVHFPNDWAQTIRLNPNQVEGFFAAVVASGPQTNFGR